ncbi:MAG: dockerin type I domain-containing protein, partial [Clostridiales bacterium]|nr:dockerin type I domain-containing protein [Clostridiales bacterium]
APTTSSFSDLALYGEYNVDDSLFTANYARTDTIYARGNYFTGNIPEGSKTLFKSRGADAFLAGFQATSGSKAAFQNRTTMFSTILNGGGIEGKPVQSVAFGSNMFYRPHYHKFYPLLATAIFAGAAGILDDQNAPVINGATWARAPFGIAVTLDAKEPDSGYVESGIEKFTFYKWDVETQKYMLFAEQPGETFEFEPENADSVFMAVVADYAGNETTCWLVSSYLNDSLTFYESDPIKTLPCLSVTSCDAGRLGEDAVYTVSIKGAKDVLNIELEFEIDGGMLSSKGAEGLSGFETASGIAWKYSGGNIWKGAVTLMHPSGSSFGFTSETPASIANIVFEAKATGDAALVLKGVRVVGVKKGEVADLAVIVEKGIATLPIDSVYSVYDLTRDGRVDALDLGIMLLYCGFSEANPEWDTLVKVTDSKGRPVTASMCDVNSDGVVDMLDLIDLFINYTKER